MTATWIDQVTIKSNYHKRDVIDWRELTPIEREQFDYIDWNELESQQYSHHFVRYKGELIDLEEFSAPHVWSPKFNYWNGYLSDSYFSGLLVKFVDSSLESVIIGRYFT